VKVLVHAVNVGYDNLDQLQADPSWDSLRNNDAFKAIMERVKTIKTQQGQKNLVECKVNIEKNDEQLSVESQVEKGTTFIFQLPKGKPVE
jgi:D-mannonate dehydratase